MPDPILSPTTQPPIAVQTNGNPADAPFGNQLEEMYQVAFAKDRPGEFKAPSDTSSAPAREVQPSNPTDEEPSKTEARTEPAKPAAGAPDPKPPAKAAQWKEVNEERARLKTENETLKAEREKWKQWETQSKEYETVKKHNAELLERMQTIAVEKDPRFENYFKTKTDTAIALAKQAVGDGHAERVSKLLQLPDSDWRTEQLETVMSELGPTRTARLGAAIVEMDRINLERSTAIAKSKENWEAMQKADRDRVQSQKQEFERTFQDTLEKWSHPEKGLALFQKKDGDEVHNAEVAQRIETARNILNLNLGAEQLSKAALWSAAAPGLLKNQMALAEENKALKEDLESLKAGGPELKGGEEGGPSPDDEKKYEGMSYGEVMAAKIKEAGGWQ